MNKRDKRVSEVFEILLKFIDKDFSHSMPVSDEGNELDAIAVGLNTMAEELQAYIAEKKNTERQIKKMENHEICFGLSEG